MLVKLYTQGVFACGAEGYGNHRYLAYCNATSYGDFDRGAFWFPLLPESVKAVDQAEVLFLGSSRMQFGFSTDTIRNWFSELDATHYLLGFTHSENIQLFTPLLRSLAPKPKAVVINVDDFFVSRISPPARLIFSEPDIADRYLTKLRWQSIHKVVCGNVAILCGSAYAVFRDRSDGHWVWQGNAMGENEIPVRLDFAPPKEEWRSNPELAKEFLAELGVARDCILFTVVPSPSTPLQEARWLAANLDVNLVEPLSDAYMTFDASHLNKPSAEHWSQSFIERAGDQLRECVR